MGRELLLRVIDKDDDIYYTMGAVFSGQFEFHNNQIFKVTHFLDYDYPQLADTWEHYSKDLPSKSLET